MEKYYVTTPIYYVNEKPHLGHAYTTIVADVMARFQREKLGSENVFFLTGTDEHGAKIEEAAAAKGSGPKEFVDLVSQQYVKAWQALDITHDFFFRTTDAGHASVVQQSLTKIYERGYIYKGKYKGIYCIGCEKNLTPDEPVNGRCPLHPTKELVEQEEENYFFRLSAFAPQVLERIESGSIAILPEERRNEIAGKIKQGINDISISRAGVKWGIPVPWDTEHTVYVWVDALFNYLSATRIVPNKERFWPADLHLMAKDILWFHALIWEALLLALGEELPRAVYAHGFFSINGQKMSKSTGNIIDPLDMVADYGTDGVRYLLLTSFTFGRDGDFSREKFDEKYNADLANGIGNLISRVGRLCESSGADYSAAFASVIPRRNEAVDAAMASVRPDDAVRLIWTGVQELDRIIAEDKPWELEGEPQVAKLTEYLKRLVGIGYDLKPFLPVTSARILETFGAARITKPAPLYMRRASSPKV